MIHLIVLRGKTFRVTRNFYIIVIDDGPLTGNDGGTGSHDSEK
jgi:hypothetical protein